MSSRSRVYMDLFANRTDVWVKQLVARDGFSYVTVKPGHKYYKPLDQSLIERHLRGEVTLSFIAVNAQGESKWCCWDSDTENGALSRIKEVVERGGFMPLHEGRRDGRDGHLWLFFDKPVPAADLLVFNAEVFRCARVVEADRVEFFPKYADRFSQMRGPLGVHRKPGAGNSRGLFEGPGNTVADQLTWLVQQPKGSAKQLTDLANLIAESRRAKRKPRASVPKAVADWLGVDILALVPDRRRKGTEWAARCPLCAAEGHDKHEDNLTISTDGRKFSCVFQGPGRVHKGRDIILCLLSQQVLRRGA